VFIHLRASMFDIFVISIYLLFAALQKSILSIDCVYRILHF